MREKEAFGAKRVLDGKSGKVSYFDINAPERQGIALISRLPFSIKVMIENLLRNVDGDQVLPENIVAMARWQPEPGEKGRRGPLPGHRTSRDAC